MSVSALISRQMGALWTIFFINGAILASWAPRIPQVKSALSLSDGQLGWALLGVAAGSIPALIGTARLLRTSSARSVCITASIAFASTLPLIALAPNGWTLGAALGVLGASSGSLDVGMNAAAIEYQNRTGPRILSRLHGGYSLGVLAGSASGALAVELDITVLEHLAAVSACLLLMAFVASPSLPTQAASARLRPLLHSSNASGRVDSRNLFAWNGVLLAVAVLACAAVLIEGMVTD